MKVLWSVVAVGLLVTGSVAAQSDPFNGQWKLNMSKSNFPAGSGGARDEVITYKIVGDVETFKADGHLGNGAHDTFEYSASYSGKEGPSKTVVTEDSVTTMRKIDARTRERVSTVDGKFTMRSHRTVSEDGKTLTSDLFRMENGKEVQYDHRVFDRQGAVPQGDTYYGNWTYNVAKSKVVPPGTKRESLTLTALPNGEEIKSVTIYGDDSEEVLTYKATYDNKGIPAKTVTTHNNLVTVRKVDANTRERISKLDGKVVGISRRVVSPDGKTETTSIYRVDANGKETLTATRVFDKL